MLTFPIDTKHGPGAVLLVEIRSIMPTMSEKELGWSLIYTDSMPEGLLIRGNPRDLVARWEVQLQVLENGGCEDEDEEDEECEEQE
jgi:hypothetical protein